MLASRAPFKRQATAKFLHHATAAGHMSVIYSRSKEMYVV
jgi:hypothetical protein